MYRLGHAITGIMPEQTYGNKKVLVVLRGCVTTCDCYNSEMIVVQPTSFDCLSVCLFVCLSLSAHFAISPAHPFIPQCICLSTHLPSLPPTHPTVSICLYLLIHPLATSPVHQSSPLPVCPSTFHRTVLDLKLFLPVCVCVFCLYSCLRDWCLRVLCFRAGMDAVLRSNSHVALDHFPVELCEVLFLLLTFSFLYI